MEPWIKNPEHLYTGKSGNVQLRAREIVANWLLCAVGNFYSDSESLIFCNDPFGEGDGIIIDRETEDQMVTEHIFIPKHNKKDKKMEKS